MARSPIERSEESAGSLKSYATGFVLSIILTAIPFAVVMYGRWPRPAVMLAVFAAASVQILAHLYYFLHLDASPGARWKLLALLFGMLIIVLIVAGTLWIMQNLAYNLS